MLPGDELAVVDTTHARESHVKLHFAGGPEIACTSQRGARRDQESHVESVSLLDYVRDTQLAEDWVKRNRGALLMVLAVIRRRDAKKKKKKGNAEARVRRSQKSTQQPGQRMGQSDESTQ